MNPITFMKTVYVGDRACKRIILDGWGNRVAIQINRISRIREPSGQWNFYSAEDIEDGLIILSEVRSFAMDPPGLMPNDEIYCIEVECLDESLEKPVYLFSFYIGHVDQLGNNQEIVVKIKAGSVHLEDPSRPDTSITD
jgi:hypothetical protein